MLESDQLVAVVTCSLLLLLMTNVQAATDEANLKQ